MLGHKDLAWLKDRINGNEKRNLVWALERLSFAHESYHDSVLMMVRLVAAKNEDISNNATGQLIQFFHISLAETEVDLKGCLDTLKEFVDKGEEYIPLVIRCFDAALQNGGFIKAGGAEKFGFENRKDYIPKTWPKIFEYWYGCRDLLLEWMNKKPELAELLAGMVEKMFITGHMEGRRMFLYCFWKKLPK